MSQRTVAGGQGAGDVAIIGGGVIGCACAWALARAGVSVTLYERVGLGTEASGASAGILAPLAESAEPGPFAELGMAGLHAFAQEIDALVEESGIDPEYRTCGVIRLALTEPEVPALQQAAAWQSNQSLGLRWIDSREVMAIEPALAPSFGALYSAEEGMVRPPLLVRALATAAARHGARIQEHSEVIGPATTGGRVTGVRLGSGVVKPAGAVLLAGGAWSAALAGSAAPAIPVRPVKGQYAMLSIVPRPLRHVVFAGHGYLVPRVDGTLYAGATQEDAGYDRRVTLDGLAAVLDMARGIAPVLGNAEVIGSGAGLRPGSADGLPILGAAPGIEGLYLATGHYRNGVLMSLITARLMAALILGEQPSIPLAPYSPMRHVQAVATGPALSS
ncbi:MAG: glycine oxidase ThiO [Dehalococcoidia bacterium]